MGEDDQQFTEEVDDDGGELVFYDRRFLPIVMLERRAVQFGPAIGLVAFGVYAALVCLSGPDGEGGDAAQLAARLDTSLSSVHRATKKLEAAGMISVDRRIEGGRRQAHRYSLLSLEAPPQPEPSPLPIRVLPLWDRTVGTVADAADHPAKIGALVDTWHTCFGADATITVAQIQQLVNAASGDYEVVAQECLKLVARLKPPIRQPFGLVKSNLTGEWKTRGKPQPVRRPQQQIGYGTVRASEEDTPF